MTHPTSSSAERYQAAITAETNPASIPPDIDAPQDGAAVDVQQGAIRRLENLTSSGRPLAELLEEAKRLVNPSDPEPNVTARGKSAAQQTIRPADIAQETSSGWLNLRPATADRLHRSGHFAETWRRARLQILPVLGAAVVGCAFGYVVAGDSRAMQLFFSATVGLGLFLVFSSLASQLRRKKR